jgi:hypothetical protein
LPPKHKTSLEIPTITVKSPGSTTYCILQFQVPTLLNLEVDLHCLGLAGLEHDLDVNSMMHMDIERFSILSKERLGFGFLNQMEMAGYNEPVNPAAGLQN